MFGPLDRVLSEESDIKMEEIQRLKEEGNANFKGGNYQTAVDRYSEALKLDSGDKSVKSVLLKNRAAVHLKTGDFSAAERDCTKGGPKWCLH